MQRTQPLPENFRRTRHRLLTSQARSGAQTARTMQVPDLGTWRFDQMFRHSKESNHDKSVAHAIFIGAPVDTKANWSGSEASSPRHKKTRLDSTESVFRSTRRIGHQSLIDEGLQIQCSVRQEEDLLAEVPEWSRQGRKLSRGNLNTAGSWEKASTGSRRGSTESQASWQRFK